MSDDSGRPGGQQIKRWWSGLEEERYWLEATDRKDIGANLQAPHHDSTGHENWRYSLFKEAKPGDIVFHYDKNPEAGGIVGWSQVAGPWREKPVIWAARGTFARARGEEPHERFGFEVPLASYRQLRQAITLQELRSLTPELRGVVGEAVWGQSLEAFGLARRAYFLPRGLHRARSIRLFWTTPEEPTNLTYLDAFQDAFKRVRRGLRLRPDLPRRLLLSRGRSGSLRISAAETALVEQVTARHGFVPLQLETLDFRGQAERCSMRNMSWVCMVPEWPTSCSAAVGFGCWS
jgi:hypothetical protein